MQICEEIAHAIVSAVERGISPERCFEILCAGADKQYAMHIFGLATNIAFLEYLFENE